MLREPRSTQELSKTKQKHSKQLNENSYLSKLNSTYLSGPELLFIFCPRPGFGPKEADEGQGGEDVREAGELGPAGLAPREGPAAGATAVGQHQAQRQEHQHAQQELLVGQSDEVPAFLIKVRESGKAKESPHGSKAPWVAPVEVEILFFLVGF